MSTQEVRVYVTNIEWDTADEDFDAGEVRDVSFLPSEVELSVFVPANFTEDDLIEHITDALSNEYGFLVFDYDYEMLN
jgi:hypothetical protein